MPLQIEQWCQWAPDLHCYLYYTGPVKPQLLLFSATIPDWVSRTAGKYMSRDKRVVDMIGQDKVKTAIAVEVCGYMCISIYGNAITLFYIQHKAIKCPYMERAATIADILQVFIYSISLRMYIQN